jgi:hypothetical protein
MSTFGRAAHAPPAWNEADEPQLGAIIESGRAAAEPLCVFWRVLVSIGASRLDFESVGQNRDTVSRPLPSCALIFAVAENINKVFGYYAVVSGPAFSLA